MRRFGRRLAEFWERHKDKIFLLTICLLSALGYFGLKAQIQHQEKQARIELKAEIAKVISKQEAEATQQRLLICEKGNERTAATRLAFTTLISLALAQDDTPPEPGTPEFLARQRFQQEFNRLVLTQLNPVDCKTFEAETTTRAADSLLP